MLCLSLKLGTGMNELQKPGILRGLEFKNFSTKEFKKIN